MFFDFCDDLERDCEGTAAILQRNYRVFAFAYGVQERLKLGVKGFLRHNLRLEDLDFGVD